MTRQVQILDVRGQPLRPTKAKMLNSGRDGAPYDAASYYDDHMAAWQPWLWSPDTELNIYRDRIVSRVRDLVRNDGWASGAVTRILDNVIGGCFRPVFKPDYRSLAAYTGIKAFDAEWADEFAKVAAANWRAYSEDIGRYCDAQRNLTMPQMFALGFRHKLVDGDVLTQCLWKPERVSLGRARYATTFQMIDPDRLSNPQLQFDQQTMRGGVQIDPETGAAEGYWIRRAHQGDWFNAVKSMQWDLIPRETAWGRAIIIHDFDHDRASQHRGGAGILTPVLQRMRMLAKYDATELDAAIINAIFSAYIESPFDHQLVEEAMGDSTELNSYQQSRSDFHNERRLALGGVRIPTLFPGEKINTVSAARPNSNFEAFEKAFLRNAAAATGLSAPQFSQDWSDINYSSARAALIEAHKTLGRQRTNYAVGYAQRVLCTWMEESMEVDDYPLPTGAPEFIECRGMYSRCRWMGPARGWVDPVAEVQGAVMGMDAGLSTLENESAEQDLDWEETLDQRAKEIERFKKLGLPLPAWSGVLNATQASKKPEAA
jgi:lambda family phage portal protein